MSHIESSLRVISVLPSPLRGRIEEGGIVVPLTLALSRKGKGNSDCSTKSTRIIITLGSGLVTGGSNE